MIKQHEPKIVKIETAKVDDVASLRAELESKNVDITDISSDYLTGAIQNANKSNDKYITFYNFGDYKGWFGGHSAEYHEDKGYYDNLLGESAKIENIRVTDIPLDKLSDVLSILGDGSWSKSFFDKYVLSQDGQPASLYYEKHLKEYYPMQYVDSQNQSPVLTYAEFMNKYSDEVVSETITPITPAEPVAEPVELVKEIAETTVEVNVPFAKKVGSLLTESAKSDAFYRELKVFATSSTKLIKMMDDVNRTNRNIKYDKNKPQEFLMQLITMEVK